MEEVRQSLPIEGFEGKLDASESNRKSGSLSTKAERRPGFAPYAETLRIYIFLLVLNCFRRKWTRCV